MEGNFQWIFSKFTKLSLTDQWLFWSIFLISPIQRVDERKDENYWSAWSSLAELCEYTAPSTCPCPPVLYSALPHKWLAQKVGICCFFWHKQIFDDVRRTGVITSDCGLQNAVQEENINKYAMKFQKLFWKWLYTFYNFQPLRYQDTTISFITLHKVLTNVSI